MGSKPREEKCLSYVLEHANRANGKTRSIISLLEGAEVQRLQTEQPDFVKKTVCNGKTTLLGIEHFRVDQLSKRIHGDQVGSTEILSEKDAEAVVKKWQKKEKITEGSDYECAEDIAKLVENHLQRSIGCSYGHFMESFLYSFDKHLKKVPIYKQNLERLKEDSEVDIKLAFLIEIHSNFSQFNKLILNDSNGDSYSSKNVKFCPMFEELVQEMEKVDPSEVDYLILCFVKSLHEKGSENFQIVPLRTGDIRRQLMQQHVRIYEYNCSDFLLRDFQSELKDVEVTHSIEKVGTDYQINYCISPRFMKNEYLLPLCYTAFYLAHKNKRSKRNFITSYVVQLLLDVCSEYLVKWELRELNGETHYLYPIFSIDNMAVFKKKIESFEKRWKTIEW